MIQPEPLICSRINNDLKAYLESKAFSNYIFLCDSNTVELCLPLLKINNPRLIVIPAGEENKNTQTLNFILEQLVKHEAGRQTPLLCLGGGMVTDIGGFAASIFKRGIPFIYIPTTLLGMVDAGIGGKTGIDFGYLKNYIGSFSVPEAVLIDLIFLNTLAENEIKSAWAEIIKIAAISDKQLFLKIKSGANLEEVIQLSIKAKLRLTNSDFYDLNERQLLNFGHSIGHAYESFRLGIKKPILHGYAVAQGLLLELKIALKLNILSIQEAAEIESLLREKVNCKAFNATEISQILKFIEADKKNINGSLIFSLPNKIGSGKTGIKISMEELKNWKNQGFI